MNGGLPEYGDLIDIPKAAAEILAAIAVGEKEVATAVGWPLLFFFFF